MQIHEIKDASGRLTMVTLSQSPGSSVTVNLYGATVTSWKSQNKEKLFLSSLAKLDGSKPVRGGIPLVFPQFGPGALPQHGFARTSWWTLAETHEHGEAAVASFVLRDTEETRASKWPYKFVLTYTVNLTSTTLSTIMRYENVDGVPFEFTSLMHTYLRVSDIAKTRVTGLSGLQYVDKVKGVRAQEDREEVTVDANEDRVYEKVPGDVAVWCEGAGVEVKRFNFEDVVFWNPWADKAREMSDFGDEEYKEMVCVEAGTVTNKISLKPGQAVTCGQLLTAKNA
ncbi:hypothetical protein GGI07_001445 [Coemansia sp. Benny D115]|nr:hypothetical protein GGI07_001445 [Coemansia sp. Benny D115]